MSGMLGRSLVLSAGLMLVLFIFSFTAWGFTTPAETRHFVGEVAAQPVQVAGLHDQYEAMTAYFSSGAGDTFTYFFRSSPVVIEKAQVAGLDEAGVIDLVLDTYADQFYDNRLASGGPGPAGFLITAPGRTIYGAVAVLTAISFVVFAGTFLAIPDRPLGDRLKSAGKTLALACVLALVLFVLLPGIVRSFFWTEVVKGGAADVWNMVEPAAVGLLLRNTLIALALAVLVYVVGFLLARKGSPAEAPPGHKHL